MGACSSKPKTTEFEGSTEHSKKTEDVGAGLSIFLDDETSQQNETGKEEERAANADTEAVQGTRELIASKDEEPLMRGLLSTEEGVSHSVKAEGDAIDSEAGNSFTEKGKSDAGNVQKVDLGAGAADIKEVSDKVSTVEKGVGGDQDKLFEDKAVVLDEVNGVDAYIDKKVAADEERARNSTMQDEQSRNLEETNESPRVESPIIGVIQPVDPIHVDDVSESGGLATIETPAHVESPVEVERDVSTGASIGEDDTIVTEEAVNLSSGPAQEAPEEKEEVLHDNSKGNPLLVRVSDDGVGQERGADRGEEVPLASADVQDETSVEDTSKLETFEDPLNDIDERTSEPQVENALEESAREPHAEVTENEGSAKVIDEPKLEALNVVESVDAGTSSEPKAETMLEEAIEGQDKGIEDEPNVNYVQQQTSAIDESAEVGRPEATPDEGVAEPSAETEREEKASEAHIEEPAVNEEKVESVDAGNLELSADQPKRVLGEVDPAFEDASDVPLKVESNTIASGDQPSS